MFTTVNPLSRNTVYVASELLTHHMMMQELATEHLQVTVSDTLSVTFCGCSSNTSVLLPSVKIDPVNSPLVYNLPASHANIPKQRHSIVRPQVQHHSSINERGGIIRWKLSMNIVLVALKSKMISIRTLADGPDPPPLPLSSQLAPVCLAHRNISRPEFIASYVRLQVNNLVVDVAVRTCTYTTRRA